MSANDALEKVRSQKLVVMRDIDSWRDTAQQMTQALGRVHPALLLGVGVLAGALVGRMVGKSNVSVKATAIALLSGALQRRVVGLVTRAVHGIQTAAAQLAGEEDAVPAPERSEPRGGE